MFNQKLMQWRILHDKLSIDGWELRSNTMDKYNKNSLFSESYYDLCIKTGYNVVQPVIATSWISINAKKQILNPKHTYRNGVLTRSIFKKICQMYTAPIISLIVCILYKAIVKRKTTKIE